MKKFMFILTPFILFGSIILLKQLKENSTELNEYFKKDDHIHLNDI